MESVLIHGRADFEIEEQIRLRRDLLRCNEMSMRQKREEMASINKVKNFEDDIEGL